jgi:hypothetical protein
VPTGIVTTELALRQRALPIGGADGGGRRCPSCGEAHHGASARYCHQCGAALDAAEGATRRS